ncbi:MAG: N-6 DNA methylase, partial [Chloroflexota bacterium]
MILVYRLLFILKLEASDDPARTFSFASTSLWRNSYSPNTALSKYAEAVLKHDSEVGSLLEEGLRALFRMFAEGLSTTELQVKPLGGALFGIDAMTLLSGLHWGERACACLLDRLLWTPGRRGSEARQRVHYGPLGVENLGRVYEALLELEPGIATEPMCRLRRQKLEVVVPLVQGEQYRTAAVRNDETLAELEESDSGQPEAEQEEEEASSRAKKTKVEWIEEIQAGQFYLRVGLGRKASGSYYTPHSFVRFLVQETLGPQVDRRSPQTDPQPAEILKLKVLDPAMGSGHFLVEACRFLGEKLYEACRLCDERASSAERRAELAKIEADRERSLDEALEFRQRIEGLPDPDQALVHYLPSHAPEGQETGVSQRRAEALCRRMVAVHCLYGVDRNPLAVELAKLALWIEAHAEGLPLTFVDHRLVVGDSLTGPFFEHILRYPGSQRPMDDLFTHGLQARFSQALDNALAHVRELEATVGLTLPDLLAKQRAKERLDKALSPFRLAAAAWAGGVMLGRSDCDDLAYAHFVQTVCDTGYQPEASQFEPSLIRMVELGLGSTCSLVSCPDELQLLISQNCVPALSYDLAFPEVFYPTGRLAEREGFDVAVANPPWDAIRPKAKEFFAAFDFDILAAPTKRERTAIEKRLKANPGLAESHHRYEDGFASQHRVHDALFNHQVAIVDGEKTGGDPDASKLFLERITQLLGPSGSTGAVVPSAFHANEGATGIRRLYLEHTKLKCCYSFENKRKLFEIDSRFKFALIVAQKGGSTDQFPCAFYLHDDELL